jgi:hypothetical protein
MEKEFLILASLSFLLEILAKWFCKENPENLELNNKIVYIGRVKGINTFNTRINQGYANIFPKNCYIDGQSTNCRINSLINTHAESIKLFILPLDNDREIIKFEKILIDLLKPEWNIQLK